MNCSACHAVDHMLVGPSLVEISGLYRENPEGFVKWCIQPQHKREGVVEMPSMAHLGEPVLRELHKYVIASAAGKTELRKGDGDPFSVPRAMVRRPQVQRIFLSDSWRQLAQGMQGLTNNFELRVVKSRDDTFSIN